MLACKPASRPRSLALALAFVLGTALACFSPPVGDVLFSCEYEGDDRCPPDYRCEADDCCHRIGSDIEAEFGACALGGNSNSGGGSTETDTDTDTDTD
jgi:hypothetical protein